MTPRFEPQPNATPDRAPRSAESGIGRPGGLLLTAVTAAIVFAVGFRLLPDRRLSEPAAPAPAPPASPDAAPPSDAGRATDALADGRNSDGRGSDGRGSDGRASDAPPAIDAPAGTYDGGAREVAATTDGAPADAPPPSEANDGRAADKPADKADKDAAREAWRHNVPAVSVSGARSTLLIPIKGSAARSTFHVNNKPRAVVVKLPRAASLITMRLYKLDRAGFRQVWIDQAEVNAQPKDGSTIKIVLTEALDPVVEIKDDYVRVTIRRPPGGASGD